MIHPKSKCVLLEPFPFYNSVCYYKTGNALTFFQTVLEFLSAGDSIEDVLAEYPTLSREDVLACLAYSAKLMRHHFSVQAVA